MIQFIHIHLGPYYYGIAQGSGNIGPQSGHHEIPSNCVPFTGSTSNLVDLSKSFEKKIIFKSDIYGRKIKDISNQTLLYIYDDGTVEKKIFFE